MNSASNSLVYYRRKISIPSESTKPIAIVHDVDEPVAFVDDSDSKPAMKQHGTDQSNEIEHVVTMHSRKTDLFVNRKIAITSILTIRLDQLMRIEILYSQDFIARQSHVTLYVSTLKTTDRK